MATVFQGYLAIQHCPTCHAEQGRFNPRLGQAGTIAAALKRKHQARYQQCDVRPRKAALIEIRDAATERVVGHATTAMRFGDVYRTILAPDAQAQYGLELRRSQEDAMQPNGLSTPITAHQRVVAADTMPMHTIRTATPPIEIMWQLAGQWRAGLHAIEASPFQPPKRDEAGIGKMAQSLAVFGQINPIHVRQLATDRLRAMDGHRRLAAARRLGLPSVIVQPHPEITTDEQELAFIHEVNTQQNAYGGVQLLQSLQHSGWDLEHFLEAANVRVRTRLNRWHLRFPDWAECQRMMLLFRTPEALHTATMLVNYLDGTTIYNKSHRTEGRQAQYEREAEMLHWMALDGGSYLGMMQRTPLLGQPTAAAIRKAMKTARAYSKLLPRTH